MQTEGFSGPGDMLAGSGVSIYMKKHKTLFWSLNRAEKGTAISQKTRIPEGQHFTSPRQ